MNGEYINIPFVILLYYLYAAMIGSTVAILTYRALKKDRIHALFLSFVLIPLGTVILLIAFEYYLHIPLMEGIKYTPPPPVVEEVDMNRQMIAGKAYKELMDLVKDEVMGHETWLVFGVDQNQEYVWIAMGDCTANVVTSKETPNGSFFGCPVLVETGVYLEDACDNMIHALIKKKYIKKWKK